MTAEAQSVDQREVEEFVNRWYEAMDRHADDDEIVDYLTPDFTITMPGPVLVEGVDDFLDFYHEGTATYFDELRRVDKLVVRPRSPLDIDVDVVLVWEARSRPPDAAKSTWEGLYLDETWSLVVQEGRLKARGCDITTMDPLPGSATGTNR